MGKMVNITLNGRQIEVPEGTTVLNAARKEGIEIPTLCHHEALEPAGLCRLCIVEVSGAVRHSIRVSCIQEVNEGLVIETDTERIQRNRRLLLELFLGRAPECNTVIDLAAKYGVTKTRFVTGENDNCVRCGLCVRICRDKIGAYALCFSHRGFDRRVTTEFESLSEYCIGCGACAQVCPTGAIRMEDRGNRRKIFIWGQVLARFKLEACDICGRPFAPKKYLDHIDEQAYRPLGLELKDRICSHCARKNKAEKLAPLVQY